MVLFQLVKNRGAGLPSFEVALHFHVVSPLMKSLTKHALGYANQMPELSLTAPIHARLQIDELAGKTGAPCFRCGLTSINDRTIKVAIKHFC
jgi:hypothetical protein